MTETVVLKSGLTKYYKNCFLLDEDTLRRIQGLLEKAAKELSPTPTVSFYIEREDNRFYEVEQISDVISDPNVQGKKVGQVMIQLQRKNTALRSTDENEILAIINFLKERKYMDKLTAYNEIRLMVAGENKNWALLLADELEPQVLRTFRAKSTPRWLLSFFLIPVILILLNVKEILPESSFQSFTLAIALTLSLIIYMSVIKPSTLPKVLRKVLGPESYFLWGEETEAYQSHEQLRTNILWGIIVGFIISLITSIISLFF